MVASEPEQTRARDWLGLLSAGDLGPGYPHLGSWGRMADGDTVTLGGEEGPQGFCPMGVFVLSPVLWAGHFFTSMNVGWGPPLVTESSC